MATLPYNTWYDATYDSIREMANWPELNVDVSRKVTCVFAWMPQTIMGVKHTGGRPKWATFSLAEVQAAVDQAVVSFALLSSFELVNVELAEIKVNLLRVLELMFPPFGTVAASKYLHFSAPGLFPMWDRSIRIARGHQDCPQGFLDYMSQFKAELLVPANLEAARAAYPANPVRGWDVVNMRNREEK